MKQEKGNSTKFQVTGCEAQASTSDAEVIAQQAFDSWVLAMEAAEGNSLVASFNSMREVARAKIEASRAARAAAEGRE